MNVAKNPIRAFDDVQKEECARAAEALRRSSQTLEEYIKFGRDWGAASSLAFAKRQWETRKALREFADREADNTWTEESG